MPATATTPAEAAYSAAVELHEDCDVTRQDLTTASAKVDLPAKGAYLIFLEAANAAVTVYGKLAAGTSAAAAPASGAREANTFAFRGDAIERVRAKAGKLALNAKVSSGTATLVVVRLR
jgi:hypothetical protein